MQDYSSTVTDDIKVSLALAQEAVEHAEHEMQARIALLERKLALALMARPTTGQVVSWLRRQNLAQTTGAIAEAYPKGDHRFALTLTWLERAHARRVGRPARR